MYVMHHKVEELMPYLAHLKMSVATHEVPVSPISFSASRFPMVVVLMRSLAASPPLWMRDICTRHPLSVIHYTPKRGKASLLIETKH
ncbi:hypothetical protein CEXT_562101 [Caerostris extrusa]|uniref:Uncharacterized protein n=1 Tax=Caerostris extrusa TaxID=172846 RepID=A0AAV4TMT7_CAEEX|nr:hypothetical protein CEXT_562101 [Caerostris extrusa]